MVRGSVKVASSVQRANFLTSGVAGEELEAVVVWVSSHNRAFYESHDYNVVKYCLSHQARLL